MVLSPTGVLMAPTQLFLFYYKGGKKIFGLKSFLGSSLSLVPAVSMVGPRCVSGWLTVLSFHLKKRFNKAQSLFCQAWLLFLFKPTCAQRRIKSLHRWLFTLKSCVVRAIWCLWDSLNILIKLWERFSFKTESVILPRINKHQLPMGSERLTWRFWMKPRFNQSKCFSP